MVSRRGFLQGTVAVTASVTGCIGWQGGQGTATPERRETVDGGVHTQFQYDAANTGLVDTDPPRTADELWRTRLDPAEGGVALAGETLVVAAGSLVGLDATDGTERWRVDVGHALDAPPTATDETAYVSVWNGGARADRGVVAVDVDEGEKRWRAVPSIDVNTPLTLAEDVLYAGGSLNSDEVIAIDASDGSVNWRFAAGEYATTAAVADGVAYVGGGKSRATFALDAESGDELWRFDAGERIWAAPTVGNDTVYVAGRDGSVWALDPANGDRQWRTNVDGAVNGSLAVTDDRLYVPTDGSLVALANDGTERWTVPLASFGHAPTVADDAVVCSDRRRLYCLATDDSTERWRHDVQERAISDAIYDGIRSPPIVVDGTVYLVSHAGDVYAIREA